MLILWPLLLPVAAVSGWYFGRNNQRHTQEKTQNHTHPLTREYFVGLNYLLNEQPDKAVDVFIKLLEVDSDTVETHLALGALFRRRGEADRAIRIHQNLIARPQLNQHQRLEALLALGRDYMRAGVLDRAEHVFQEVVNSRGEQMLVGLQYLVEIYQQEKAWEQAIGVAQQLEAVSGQRMNHVVAHYHCERVEEALLNQKIEMAKQHLSKAFAVDKNSVRASLLRARLSAKEGKYKAAIKDYKRIKLQDPDFLSVAIPELMQCYERLGSDDECLRYLYNTLEQYPRISIILSLANSLKQTKGIEAAIDFVTEQLSHSPSIRGLNQLIQWHLDTTYGKVKEKLQVLQNVLTKVLENKPIFRCGVCGFGSKTLHWHCPGCKKWSTIKPVHGLDGD